jgi:hypothetical protein
MAGPVKRRHNVVKNRGRLFDMPELAQTRLHPRPRCFRLRILPNAVLAAQEGHLALLMPANRFLQ